MTIIHLFCPKCRNQQGYENNDIDTSKEITCSRCGFSDLPTGFELAKKHETKSWLIAKIVIIILAGIAFALTWPFLITLALPLTVAAVIVILLYTRWKEKQAKG